MAAQLAGSSGVGAGRRPSRTAWAVWSMLVTVRPRSSAQVAPCSRASSPVRASCGWMPSAVVQRRNSWRWRASPAVGPRKPRGSRTVSPRAGSARISFAARAQAKNCRSPVRVLFRFAGRVLRNASMSCTSAVAQSSFPRSAARKTARSRTAARRSSIVLSARGRVPARRARSRAVRHAAANAATAGRSGPGTASILRCRRPAASRSAWSVGTAMPRSTKNACRVRAREPGDVPRPGSRERSSRACGCRDPLSASSRPSWPTRPAARDGVNPVAAKAAKPASQAGGSSSRAARLLAATSGRPGFFCQQRPHRPSPEWRRSSPHPAQTRGGSFGGPGREQLPHQPVSSRKNPCLPQRGHSSLACSRSRR